MNLCNELWKCFAEFPIFHSVRSSKLFQSLGWARCTSTMLASCHSHWKPHNDWMWHIIFGFTRIWYFVFEKFPRIQHSLNHTEDIQTQAQPSSRMAFALAEKSVNSVLLICQTNQIMILSDTHSYTHTHAPHRKCCMVSVMRQTDQVNEFRINGQHRHIVQLWWRTIYVYIYEQIIAV